MPLVAEPLLAGVLRDVSGSFLAAVGGLMVAGTLVLAESHPRSGSPRRRAISEPALAPL